MSNVQLSGSKQFDSHILIHSCTQNNDVSLAKTVINVFLRSILNMESLIRENIGKEPVKEN